MVEDRIQDGKRLAELLSSEVHGRESGPLGRLAVVDADREVEPDEFGAYAYAIALAGEPSDASRASSDEPSDGDERIAAVHVHPDRIHLEFVRVPEAAADAARAAGLRVRPKAVDPPRTLVFVEDGAEVKRATDVLAAVVESLDRVDPTADGDTDGEGSD